jgi:serine/threonine protein kinase
LKVIFDSNKIKEHIHESFIGVNCINNLVKQVPNFLYNFGVVKEDGTCNVITEYIEAPNLLDYIKSDSYNFNDYILITTQICLALQIAQNNYNFVHNDVTPWNIMIKKLEEPVFIDYVLNFETVIRLKTHIIPVLIDYGKSNITFNNINHGFVNLYKFSTCQDIISYLVTSLFQIIVDKPDTLNDNIIKISNFISGTTYCKNIFKTFKDITTFFYNAKKYSNLINSNKHELENKTPIDLFYYIRDNIPEFKYVQFSFVGEYINFHCFSLSNNLNWFGFVVSFKNIFLTSSFE